MAFWLARGMGSCPAGAAAAGDDAPVFASPSPAPTLPAAVNWDAATRSFTTPIHPVDQQVQMLLTIEQGSVPSLGPIGQRYRQRFQGAPQNHIPALALDETKVALATLLRNGDIELRAVTVLSSTPGSNVVVVDYTNLRNPVLAQRRQQAKVTV